MKVWVGQEQFDANYRMYASGEGLDGWVLDVTDEFWDRYREILYRWSEIQSEIEEKVRRRGIIDVENLHSGTDEGQTEVEFPSV